MAPTNPPKPKRPSILNRIRSRVSAQSEPSEPQQPKHMIADKYQTPKKYNYLDKIFNKTVVDNQGQPTREIRVVLGWHYDSKDTKSWSYSVTDKSRTMFEWIREEDTELLTDDVAPNVPEKAEGSK